MREDADLIDVEYKIDCSSCDAPLAKILVTRDTGTVNNIIVECPHCGDRSFKKKIVGDYYLVPTIYTSVVNIIDSDNVIVMKTIKSKEWK